MTALLVILVFVFFAIVSIVYFIGWQSSRDPSVLGGVALVWLVLIVFLLIVIFGPKNL